MVQSSSISLAPSFATGIITMWHGLIVDIPAGWLLCDGTHSTPDLRASFIRGAPDGVDPGTTGGEDTHVLTDAEMPAHVHTLPHMVGAGSGAVTRSSSAGTGIAPNTGSTGSGDAHNNLPSYYEVLYLMKD